MFRPFLLLLSHSIFLALSCPPGWQSSGVLPGKCYLFVNPEPGSGKSWFEAENYCKSAAVDGHLTSITSAYENYDIFGQANHDCAQFWIGLNDLGIIGTGKFDTWSDGQAVQYKNWDAGQPVTGTDKHCISMNGQTDGRWVTEDCNDPICFICETFHSSDMTTPSTSTAPTTSPKAMTDCYDWLHIGGKKTDGVYQITIPGTTNPSAVWCDMTTDGGGWTVFQRRLSGSQTFYNKTWDQYKKGFYDVGLDKNLWLGNDAIHLLSTKDANVDLRIDLWGDRTPNSRYLNIYLWQKQTSFYIDSEANYYTLHVNTAVEGNASFSGSANAGINYNIGHPFSTNDNRHDNCNGCCNQTPYDLGGWWSSFCTFSSLNGKYVPSGWASHFGYSWYTGNYYINPAHSTMMLRRAP